MVRKSLKVNSSVSKRGFSAQRVMHAHGEQWKALPEAKKRHYEQIAETMRNERDLDIRERLAEERERLMVHREQGQSERQVSTPGMQASSASFRPADLEAFETIRAAKLYTAAQVQSLRERARNCPRPLSTPQYDSLRAKSSLPSENTQLSTELVHALCRARDSLGCCVVCVHMEGSWAWYAFLNALQQPMSLFLLHLEYLPLVGPDISSGTKLEWMQNQYQQYTYHWTFESWSFAGAAVLRDVEPSDVYIIPSCVYLSGNYIVTRDEMLTLGQALAGCEQKLASTERKERKTSAGTSSGDTSKNKGLEALLKMTPDAPGPPRHVASQSMHSKSTSAEESCVQSEEQESDEETPLAEAWTSLEEARQTYKDTAENVDSEFYIRLDGGHWQRERTGRLIY
eukprot:4029064-Amphidinium_carterae.1